MELNSGDAAPGFATTDIFGKPVRLKDYEGKKLLICFYRYAGCPFCNVLLHSLIERYPKLHFRGLEVVAFLQSPREKIFEYPMKRQNPKPPFPLVADPNMEIYNLYKVKLSAAGMAKGAVKAPALISKMIKHHYPQGKIEGKFLLMPAFFLINKDQTIHQAHYGADFRDSIPDVDILNFLLFE
jgi:peroxiredoxin